MGTRSSSLQFSPGVRSEAGNRVLATETGVRPRQRTWRYVEQAGLPAGEDHQGLITQRIRRWRFSHPDERDVQDHDAVRAAAAFLQEHAELFPAGELPSGSTQLAALALEIYEFFLEGGDGSGTSPRALDATGIAEAVIQLRRALDSRRGDPGLTRAARVPAAPEENERNVQRRRSEWIRSGSTSRK